MTSQEAFDMLTGDAGVGLWNKFREEGGVPPSLAGRDFTGAGLNGVNFRDVDLRGATLTGAHLQGADLTSANLHTAKLDTAILNQAILIDTNLTEAILCSATLLQTVFDRTRVSQADFTSANLRKISFSGYVLRDVVFINAHLEQADFTNASLANTQLRGAHCDNAFFNNTNLQGAHLQGTFLLGASLQGADLRGAHVSVATTLRGARVEGCRIDRHTLESLEGHGGLTRGDRMRMIIEDGVATLRASYSGFWQWIHIVALTIFVSPYVFFVAECLIRERFGLDIEGARVTLRVGLGRFIVNGGENLDTWSLAPLVFAWFVFSLLYNLLRALLLWKTKTLELSEESSGLPAPFSLRGTWLRLYKAAQWGFVANLVVVSLHTWHFLGTRVTLPLVD